MPGSAWDGRLARAVRRDWGVSIPVVHFSDLCPPVVLCVKLDTTDGAYACPPRPWKANGPGKAT